MAGKSLRIATPKPAAGDLKSLLKQGFTAASPRPFLEKDSYLRVSAFASLCPREEVLVSRARLLRESEVSADLNMIFAHGHALHYAMQNIVMPSIGVLFGQWICLTCGLLHGKLPESAVSKDVALYAIPRPDACVSCESTEFLFKEYDLVDHQYRITGHSDGFLSLEGMPGLGILEGKSINPKGAWEVRSCPKLDHVIQAQCYMWLTGLQWGKILYWDKSGMGLSALIEHTIERDEETIETVQETLQEIWDGVNFRSDRLPERICESCDAPRAESCSVVDTCFMVTE